ncbi:MAG: hypothetical protein ACT4P1_13030 [Sporichthyaceae bacterium]
MNTVVTPSFTARPLADLPPVVPSDDGLPGGQAIDTLLSWAMYLGLTACVLGAIGAGAAIGVGNLSSRPHWSERGKLALVASVIGALIVGSAVTIVNTGFGMA